MSDSAIAAVVEQLQNISQTDSGVADEYMHISKVVSTLDPIVTPEAAFKWYNIKAANGAIPDHIITLARDCVEKTRLEASGMGFVILHRCGEDFYFLLISTWRGSNEL
ncbi:MAG: hypothetical protein WBD22_08790 [Pyrinomonadaceae bacterium]